MSPSDLPALDCHAHIAPDVTRPQVAGLHGALVLAMTRSPAEAAAAARREDATLAWGFGVHPVVPAAVDALTDDLADRAVRRHAIIGEIGLDRRRPSGRQRAAFETLLRACAGQPVLLSVHSTGRTRQVLDLLQQEPHPGAVLHWFNGTPDEIDRAVALGCYFSVNNAISDERLAAMPPDLLLPETDFPSSRRTTRASRPGDVRALETRLAARDGTTVAAVRQSWYSNLLRLTERSRALPRLPHELQSALRRLA